MKSKGFLLLAYCLLVPHLALATAPLVYTNFKQLADYGAYGCHAPTSAENLEPIFACIEEDDLKIVKYNTSKNRFIEIETGIKAEDEAFYDFAVGFNGKEAVILFENSYYVFDLETKKLTFSQTNVNPYIKEDEFRRTGIVAYNEVGYSIAFTANILSANPGQYKTTAILMVNGKKDTYEVDHGEMVFPMRFVFKGKFYCLQTSENKIVLFDLSKAKIYSSFQLQNQEYQMGVTMTSHRQGEFLSVVADEGVALYDLVGKRLLINKTFHVEDYLASMSYIDKKSDNLVIYTDNMHVISFSMANYQLSGFQQFGYEKEIDVPQSYFAEGLGWRLDEEGIEILKGTTQSDMTGLH